MGICTLGARIVLNYSRYCKVYYIRIYTEIMKVLLIDSNRLIPPITPIGLAYLAASLKKEGHIVRILELCISEDVEKSISRCLSEFNPDIIGISIRNVDNVTYAHSVFYIPEIKQVVDCCKKLSVVKIILGGPGFTLLPEKILNYCGLRIGIIGEGERTFPEVLRKIEKREDIKDISGVVYLKESTYVRNAIQNMNSDDLNKIPDPERDLLNNEKYLRDGGMGNIQTKRGCSLNCIYCTYPLIEGRTFRLFSPSRVANELKMMIDHWGIDYVHFVDSTFNVPPEHAVKVCQEIIKRDIRVKWSPYINPRYLSKELLDLMIKAGCDGIVFGTDTGSDKMLVNMGKNFDVNSIKYASTLCKSAGMEFSHNLLLGGPGEDINTLEETLALMEEIEPTAVGIMAGIRIYPGSKVAEIAEAEGVIQKDEDLLIPKFYISSNIGKDALVERIHEFNQTHTNCFIPTTDKGIHSEDMAVQIYREGIRGPFWRIYGELRRRVADSLKKSKG